MPPVKERRTRRSFSLHPCSIFHIPLRKRSVRRSGCSPRPSEVPRGRGQKREDYPAQEPGAAPEHLGQIVGKSGVNASARSVRGSRPRPARNKLSGAYAQALITRRSAVSIAQFFGRTPSVFPDIFLRKNFLPRVRGVLRPAAETPPSPARRWGDSISPALTERRELSGRAIVHRIVRRARQAHEVPETVRILRVILGRPDVMHPPAPPRADRTGPLPGTDIRPAGAPAARSRRQRLFFRE